MNKLINNSKFQIFSVLFIVASVYTKIFNGFFQQDEWFSFGWFVIHRNLNLFERLKFVFAPSVGHYNPLTNLLQDRLYYFWGLNYFNFATVGIFLHLMVVLMFYFFARLFFEKNKLILFLTTILFGLTASIHQGVSWVVADLSTLIASFFGLISASTFLIFNDNKKTNYLIYSMLSLIVSLLFKEVAIGLFLLYFIYLYLYDKSESRYKNIKLVFLVGFLYLALRVSMVFLPGITNDKLVTASQPISLVFYNLFTIPLKIMTQTIFTSDFLMEISMYASNFYSVNKTMGFLSISIGVFLTLWLAKNLYSNEKYKNYGKNILFCFGWVVANSFIFSMSPETSGSIIAVDSRNLYFVATGFSILVALIIKILSGNDSKKIIWYFLPLLAFNLYWLNHNLDKVVQPGQIRRQILGQIKNDYPDLPNKVVFYVSSDASYYGLPEKDKILPFQSGLGQTLVAWYFDSEAYPDSFYQDRFLWDIKSQGYKEAGDIGFGYFRDYGLLKQTVQEYNLPAESVIAYSWDSQTMSLINITQKIRTKLAND